MAAPVLIPRPPTQHLGAGNDGSSQLLANRRWALRAVFRVREGGGVFEMCDSVRAVGGRGARFRCGPGIRAVVRVRPYIRARRNVVPGPLWLCAMLRSPRTSVTGAWGGYK